MADSTIRNGAAGMTTVTANPAISSMRSAIWTPEEREWIKAGRVYSFGSGILTTPDSFQTDLVRQTPENMIRVPKGTVIIPMMALVAPEATGAAVFQVLVSACANDPGTSNAVAGTTVVANVNTRYSTQNPRSATYRVTGGSTGTAPSGVVDLWHHYQQVDNDAITGAPTPPVMYRPSIGLGQECVIGDNAGVNAFLFYVANGTSSTGFTLVVFAEFTYDEYYAGS